MIAAAPDATSKLGLICVVLNTLIKDLESNISNELKAYTLNVIKDAAKITANPGLINAQTRTEAIELANLIQGNSDLKNELTKLTGFGAIEKDVAAKILNSIQAIAA